MKQNEVAETMMTAITDIQEKSGDKSPEMQPGTTAIDGIPELWQPAGPLAIRFDGAHLQSRATH